MSEFNISERHENNICILELHGMLDAHTTNSLEDAFKRNISKGYIKIIVNLKNLEYITSAGLGVFMEFIEEIRENKGDILFCCYSQKIYKIFDLLGFPVIFQFFDEENDAIKFFQE